MRRITVLLLAAALVASACGRDDTARDDAADPRRSEDPSVLGEQRTSHEDDAIGDIPSVPESAADAAADLTRVEQALRSDDRSEEHEEELSRLGHEQQVAYQALARNPEWIEQVLAAVPDSVRAAIEANTRAAVELSRIGGGDPPEELPTWEVVAPPSPDELLGYYREAQERYGIRWEYLAAIHHVETRMSRIRGDSVAGAQGPMQFIPPTWEIYGEGSVHDHRDAIVAAARYLEDRGGPHDMDAALHAYNPTRHYVAAVRSFAEVMMDDPRAYHGYYHWRVYYHTADGRYLLPEGYGAGEPEIAVD